MLFLYYSCEGCSSPEQIGRLTLPQFRSMAVAAKVVSAQFTADRVDDIFTRVATSESVLNRCAHVLRVLPESTEWHCGVCDQIMPAAGLHTVTL